MGVEMGDGLDGNTHPERAFFCPVFILKVDRPVLAGNIQTNEQIRLRYSGTQS